ncbi:uncharacterized protein PHACADRAFT_24615 [Phanerochaete carnosa HHB-10118-sp]|uniref:Exosome complex protein n=1 Tax=Phanerochaete carnosa (strain HHB-10118-sp) TaxID=650164 RepID=K5WPN1_PHACS|nr:uncharacterized protein PHACADRAFT_24615 [Phanerochaete carnosa HHB-10118-sp]EKM61415.1 hypothetical protein PHACADRAFT_24615 [Phanerochaete carnosa HHB-10118-sp]
MSASTSKVSAKIRALDASLDELEAKLEPLFAQTLPEAVVGLEKIQQAKLQVALPYLVYDLIFSASITPLYRTQVSSVFAEVYLKTRGVDPKTHHVVQELDRVRQYFDKIKNAEDPTKQRMAIDKGVANRFIKHAIAQVKVGRPPGQDEGTSIQRNDVRVPVKITSKMVARAEYEKELKDMDDEEEDDLKVIDDAESDASGKSSNPRKSKGKQRATDEVAIVVDPAAGQKRQRLIADPFAGYDDESEDPPAKRSAKSSPTVSDIDTPGTSRSGTPQTGSDATSAKTKKRTAQKKARKKAKQVAAMNACTAS